MEISEAWGKECVVRIMSSEREEECQLFDHSKLPLSCTILAIRKSFPLIKWSSFFEINSRNEEKWRHVFVFTFCHVKKWRHDFILHFNVKYLSARYTFFSSFGSSCLFTIHNPIKKRKSFKSRPSIHWIYIVLS